MDATYEILRGFFPAIAGWPSWLVLVLIAILPAIACFTFMSLGPVGYVYAERKISAFMQDRLGPMRVGPYGVLQTIADTIKLLPLVAVGGLRGQEALYASSWFRTITAETFG